MESVIVVGAGITGCFTAYFLAQNGIAVTLIDPDGPGQQASGHNPGGLNPFHGPGIPGPSQALALHSFRLHHEHQQQIAKLIGENVRIRRVTRIELAFDAQEALALHKMTKLYKDAEGFSARWLDRKSLSSIEPRCTSAAVGGLFMEGNGEVDSQFYTQAVCRAAQKLGTQFVRAKVLRLEGNNKRITMAVSDGGKHSCDSVVVTTGPWMKEPERWLGLSLPVTPLKGELLHAVLPGDPFEHHITHRTVGVYTLPSGHAWFGGTQEDAGYDTCPTTKGRQTILGKVTQLIPCLDGCEIIGHEAALRPVTPDGLPVIGRAPGWENVYVASGAGPKGMLMGAGMADSIVKLIKGNAPAFDLEPFSLDRFNTPHQKSKILKPDESRDQCHSIGC